MKTTLRLLAVASLLLAQLAAVPIVQASHATAPGADLGIDVRTQSTMYPNRTYPLFLTTTNAGPETATNVTVTVDLPSSIQFQAFGSDSACSGTPTGDVTCSFARHDAHGAGIVVLQIRPTQAGTFPITGQISADQPDANPANNTSTANAVVSVPTEADVSISGDPQAMQTAYAGEPFPVIVGIQNAGPADATGVTLTLDVAPGFSLDAASSSNCDQEAPGADIVCALGSQSAMTINPFMVWLVAADDGEYAVTASVTADQPDPNPANNSRTGTVTVRPSADLSVTIAESADPVKRGGRLTLTLTATNAGPSAVGDAQLSYGWTDTLTGGVTLVGATSSQGTCEVLAGGVTCELGTLESGGSATVVVELKARGRGTITSTAEASGTVRDPDQSNNSTTESTAVGG